MCCKERIDTRSFYFCGDDYYQADLFAGSMHGLKIICHKAHLGKVAVIGSTGLPLGEENVGAQSAQLIAA